MTSQVRRAANRSSWAEGWGEGRTDGKRIKKYSVHELPRKYWWSFFCRIPEPNTENQMYYRPYLHNLSHPLWFLSLSILQSSNNLIFVGCPSVLLLCCWGLGVNIFVKLGLLLWATHHWLAENLGVCEIWQSIQVAVLILSMHFAGENLCTGE